AHVAHHRELLARGRECRVVVGVRTARRRELLARDVEAAEHERRFGRRRGAPVRVERIAGMRRRAALLLGERQRQRALGKVARAASPASRYIVAALIAGYAELFFANSAP